VYVVLPATRGYRIGFDFNCFGWTRAARIEEQAAQKRGISGARKLPIFERFEAHLPQAVAMEVLAGAYFQAANAGDGAIDDTGELAGQRCVPLFREPALGFVRYKPCGRTIGLLWRFEMRDLAEMSGNGVAGRGSFRETIAGERHLFDAAVDASLFEGLKGRGLGLGEAGLDATFGKDPASAAGSNEEEFNSASAGAVADGRDLLAPGGAHSGGLLYLL